MAAESLKKLKKALGVASLEQLFITSQPIGCVRHLKGAHRPSLKAGVQRR